MSNWEAKIAEMNVKIPRRLNDIHINCTEQVLDGIKRGSPTTGAPGQPVDTGNLINSWDSKFIKRLLSRVSTNVEYAEIVEEGGFTAASSRSGGMSANWTQRSKVGGPHSVKLTRSGWQRIVDKAVKEVVRD